MKKLITILIIFVLLFLCVACNYASSDMSQSEIESNSSDVSKAENTSTPTYETTSQPNISQAPIDGEQQTGTLLGEYTFISESDGKSIAGIYSAEQIADIQKRRNNGEKLYLSNDELLFIVNDTISLFETYDLICITDIDGNVSSYNGLSFYKSDEYYSLFNKLSPDNNITYSFDLDNDICEVIYKRIEVLNENTCDDFTMSGMTTGASVAFANPNKDVNSEKLKEISEYIYAVYYCDRSNLSNKLTDYQCCGLIFQDDYIYYIDDLSSGTSEKLTLLHPHDNYKGNAGKYEYGNNEHSIIAEIYDETDKCIIARIRIADPEQVNAIEKLWQEMYSSMDANDPQKVFKPSDYRVVVYLNGIGEGFYYKYDDFCNEWSFMASENFLGNMFQLTGSSNLAAYLNNIILKVVGDVFQ